MWNLDINNILFHYFRQKFQRANFEYITFYNSDTQNYDTNKTKIYILSNIDMCLFVINVTHKETANY